MGSGGAAITEEQRRRIQSYLRSAAAKEKAVAGAGAAGR
jgi:hypothetical protein